MNKTVFSCNFFDKLFIKDISCTGYKKFLAFNDKVKRTIFLVFFRDVSVCLNLCVF